MDDRQNNPVPPMSAATKQLLRALATTANERLERRGGASVPMLVEVANRQKIV